MDISGKRQIIRLKKALRLLPYLLPAGVLALSTVASVFTPNNGRTTAIIMDATPEPSPYTQLDAQFTTVATKNLHGDPDTLDGLVQTLVTNHAPTASGWTSPVTATQDTAVVMNNISLFDVEP